MVGNASCTRDAGRGGLHRDAEKGGLCKECWEMSSLQGILENVVFGEGWVGQYQRVSGVGGGRGDAGGHRASVTPCSTLPLMFHIFCYNPNLPAFDGPAPDKVRITTSRPGRG